jgi:L-ascorbate metabolism protein UlaG (beta-lactamase superfamily)
MRFKQTMKYLNTNVIRFLSIISLAFIFATAEGCGVTGKIDPLYITASQAQGNPVALQNHPWYSTSHHLADGFQNSYGRDEFPGFGRISRWLLTKPMREKDHPAPPLLPLTRAELERSPNRYRIYWLGHSTTLIRLNGSTLITDPIFSDRASPFTTIGPKRHVSTPISIEDIPHIDTVLISHSHYDHMDQESILRIARLFSPRFFVPLGLKNILIEWGVLPRLIVEMDWWQYVDSGPLRVHCVPARHFSSRTPFDRNVTLWTGWYIEEPKNGVRIYFAGDTGYEGHFRDIAERIAPPSISLIPIGAYEPGWLMQRVHVNPEEAIAAAIDLRTERIIGIHWGTYDLADEPFDEPPRRATEAARRNGFGPERFRVLPVGGWIED